MSTSGVFGSSSECSCVDTDCFCFSPLALEFMCHFMFSCGLNSAGKISKLCQSTRSKFYLTREEPTALFLVEVSERCGKKRREVSRSVSTKRLPQCVCSILSISKAGPPAHSCVVVCSYLAQPYPRTLRTIPTVGVFVHNSWYLLLGSRMGQRTMSNRGA